MAEYLIQDTTLTGIADAIREKTGETNNIIVNDYADMILNIGSGGNSSDISNLFPNGITWTQSNLTTRTISKFAYGKGIFVGTCSNATNSYYGLYYSTDGKTWNGSMFAERFSGICYANGLWVSSATGYNNASGFYYSTDGIIWTQSNLTTGYSSQIIFGDGIFVAAVDKNYTTDPYGLYYSTDGKTWTQSNLIVEDSFIKIYYANGLWIASSYSLGLYYSTDGKTWTKSDLTNGASSICYANNLWVVGEYYSTDGKTWTKSNNISGFNAVNYANNIWVGTYGTKAYYSTDGKTWTKSDSTIAYCNNICYMDGVWMIPTGNGVYCSVDGKIWTITNLTGTTSNLYYANGIWLASGSDGNGIGIYYFDTLENKFN